MSVPHNRHEPHGLKRPPRPKPLACLKDWDFWRFMLAALGLLWEIVKTEYLK